MCSKNKVKSKLRQDGDTIGPNELSASTQSVFRRSTIALAPSSTLYGNNCSEARARFCDGRELSEMTNEDLKAEAAVNTATSQGFRALPSVGSRHHTGNA